jgi:hypothetical protein
MKINRAGLIPLQEPKKPPTVKKNGLNMRFPAKFQLHHPRSYRILNLAGDEMSLKSDADWKAAKDTVTIGRLF